MLLTSGPVLSAGAKLGDFVLVEPRGQKGTLSLWLARSRDGDQVLLTVGPVRAQSREGRVRERLRLSFEQARTLSHPNLVRVLGVGVEDGQHYVASEFVDGVMLSQLLERSAGGPPVPPFLAAWIAAEITRALAYLEGASGGALALATELTPSSILLTRHGAVKLAELVAAVETQDLVETAGQDSVGVAAYLSPEVAASGAKDKRSALFGLGAILWELLSGKPLFRRSTELETLAAVRTADIPPLPPHLPPPLLRIVTRCLSRLPDERYPTAAALVEELDAALYGRVGIGPAELASTIAPLLLGSAPKRKTAMLSDVEQSGRPSPRHEKTVPSEPPFAIAEARGPNPTEPSDPPSVAIRAGEVMRVTKPSDPFFDPARDAGAIVNPRFQVLGRLGAGGMGEVYRVRDAELDEIVALKVIPRNAGNDAQSLERLRREVRLARRISSDHVCRIFDIVDLGNGGRGLTMAMVKGVTLAELMKSGLTIDYRRFARWGAEIADGLAAAHGLSIVHRDLKPENVMIREDDQAVVLDFGIARTSAEVPEPVDGKLTQQGIIMGTPLYMSPEQLTNRPLDGRSDLYALGLIMAELITGEVPLRGEGYSQILEERVLKATPYAIREIDPRVPEEIAVVVDALLKPAAQDRPATATTVAQLLFRAAGSQKSGPVLAGESVPKGVATPDRPQPRSGSQKPLPRAPSKHKRPPPYGLYAGVGIVVAALLGAFGWWSTQQRPTVDPVPPDPPVVAPPRLILDASTPDAAEVEPDAGVAPDAGKKKPYVPPAVEM